MFNVLYRGRVRLFNPGGEQQEGLHIHPAGELRERLHLG